MPSRIKLLKMGTNLVLDYTRLLYQCFSLIDLPRTGVGRDKYIKSDIISGQIIIYSLENHTVF
jgi:hypothetical protein